MGLRAPGSTPTQDIRKSSISRNNSSIQPPPKVPFKKEDRVIVSGSKIGNVKYIGTTEFSEGIWVGVELDQPNGKNDGSVKDKRYFNCQPNYGVFAPLGKIIKAGAGGPPPGAMRRDKSTLSVSSFGSMASTASNVQEARRRAAAEARARIAAARARGAGTAPKPQMPKSPTSGT